MNEWNYGHHSNGDLLDVKSILGFLDSDNETPESRPSGASLTSLSRGAANTLLFNGGYGVEANGLITSPLDALDKIRNAENNDFQTNGIDMELDEFDLYQARRREVPLPLPTTSLLDQSVGAPDMKRRRKGKAKNTVCVFCKNNGETLSVYGTHLLKDVSGRVTCPILRRYTCPICGAVGDTAHTIKYCPLNTNPVSCLSLLRTPRSSNGKNRHS